MMSEFGRNHLAKMAKTAIMWDSKKSKVSKHYEKDFFDKFLKHKIIVLFYW